MTRILNEKWLTKVDFSKGVIELTEWEEKIYQQGKADAIEECIEKLYEVTPHTIDQKLDMVFVNALRELKEQKNE